MKRRTSPLLQPLVPDSPSEKQKVSGFSLRGGNVSRLEGFSDAVFGFALTILVVSLNPPRTFADLQQTVRGAGAFALCFAALILIWYKHYRFFREYGLEDGKTIVLNSMLLFTVLFYVYPLRLLFELWVASLMRDRKAVVSMVTTWHDVGKIILLFGVGCAAVLAIFGLLYGHALNKSKDLNLSPHEHADTLVSCQMNLCGAGISLLSVLLGVVLPGRQVLLSPWVYILILPMVFILEPYLRRKAKAKS